MRLTPRGFLLPLFEDKAVEVNEELDRLLHPLFRSERVFSKNEMNFPTLGFEKKPTEPDARHVAEVGTDVNLRVSCPVYGGDIRDQRNRSQGFFQGAPGFVTNKDEPRVEIL